MTKHKNIGSSYDNLLIEEELLTEATAEAVKWILAWQITEAMKTDHISKAEPARRMQTSWAALERLLDPDNLAITLKTLQKAAKVLGKQIRMELVG
jgi:hypothetical protein